MSLRLVTFLRHTQCVFAYVVTTNCRSCTGVVRVVNRTGVIIANHWKQLEGEDKQWRGT